MDAIRALFKGPPSDEPQDYIDWLYHLNHQLSQSPMPHFQKVGEPLKKSADLLIKINNAPEAEQQAAINTIDVWMLEAQSLAMYAFIEEFRKLTEAVAGQLKSMKPGPNRDQFVKLDAAYREIFSMLATTYNGAIEGKVEALENFPIAFAKADALVQQLKN